MIPVLLSFCWWFSQYFITKAFPLLAVSVCFISTWKWKECWTTRQVPNQVTHKNGDLFIDKLICYFKYINLKLTYILWGEKVIKSLQNVKITFTDGIYYLLFTTDNTRVYIYNLLCRIVRTLWKLTKRFKECKTFNTFF